MTASELAAFYLDDSAYQVSKVFEGLNEDQADEKLSDASMSARETLIHLTDCALAAQTKLSGEADYAWGSYRPTERSLESLVETLNAERAKAVAMVRAGGDDEKSLHYAAEFLVAHDYYHVGQMASLRLKLTPAWDPYSIYR